MNQKVVVYQLNVMGYVVDIVFNGVEVLEKLVWCVYVLILMDCQMLVLDGYEIMCCIWCLQGELVYIFIVVMIVNVMVGDWEQCLEVGMDDYLIKFLLCL